MGLSIQWRNPKLSSKSISLLIAWIFLIGTSLTGAHSATVDWQLGYGDASTYPYKSVTTPSGTSYIVGQKYANNGGLPSDTDCFIQSVTDSGVVSTNYGFGFDEELCAATNVSLYNSNTLLVSVTRQATNPPGISSEFYLVPNTLTSSSLVVSIPGEQATGAVADSLGNIYVTSGSGNYGESIFTRKYSPSNDGSNAFSKSWEAEFIVSAEAAAYSYDLDVSDSTGQIYVGIDLDQYAESRVLSYGIADGVLAWERVTPGPVYSVTVDDSSNTNSIIASGSLLNSQDGYVMKIASSGRVAWQNTISSTSEDYASDAIADANGQVSVVGITYGNLVGTSNGGIDSFIFTYGSNGSLLDQSQFGSSDNDSANSVGVDSQGRTYVFGWRNPSLSLLASSRKQVLSKSTTTAIETPPSFLNRFAKVSAKGGSSKTKKPPKK